MQASAWTLQTTNGFYYIQRCVGYEEVRQLSAGLPTLLVRHISPDTFAQPSGPQNWLLGSSLLCCEEAVFLCERYPTFRRTPVPIAHSSWTAGPWRSLETSRTTRPTSSRLECSAGPLWEPEPQTSWLSSSSNYRHLLSPRQLCRICQTGGISFNLSSRWRWSVSFTPRLLYPWGNDPWYPSDRRLGISTPNRPARRLGTVRSELSGSWFFQKIKWT